MDQGDPGRVELTQLATLISQAVSVVGDEYALAGHAFPLLNSTKAGPFDAPERTSETLRVAIKTIEAACAQLSAMVANPGHVITNKTFNYFESACLRIVMEAKISDLLLDRPEGVHVNELGEKSDRDPGKLSRVLRALATNHVYVEVKPNVFANNRLSLKLLSSDPVYGLVGHMSDEAMKAGAFLGDVLADPQTAFSYEAKNVAFKKANGVLPFEMNIIDKLRGERFNQGMVGWAEVTGRAMIPRIYPWSALPSDATIVDVGGGNGHAVLEVIKAFPHLKAIIQDTESVAKDGKKFWTQIYPEAINNQRVQFKAFDFLKEPPYANCDIYYLRHVLHDWAGDAPVTILSNVRKAMKSTSKLLIHEFVPQYIVREKSSKAPEPLLPNYGAASRRLYFQDLNMMQQFNSKERTLEEFIEMGNKAGFEFVKLWDGGEAGILEFNLNKQ
ncbi:hypothetical protein VKT23_011884 [Stygiomarasmius scandens]|uniref:O-methyltransferase C-terminal domain-containing protein n=1 Tax=Marasmiellus scandens TaxID=2682957 RepID=A0ABR1J7Z7_9AGAR